MKHILPISLLLFFACAISAQNTYYFTVKFPDDKIVTGCDAVPPNDWPVISNTPNCLFGVGVSVKDQYFMTGTGSCGKILRRWRLLYWCDYDPNWGYPTVVYNPANTDEGPTVIGNSQNHGYLEYTQVIKLLDGGSPTFINCPTAPVTFCDYSTNDPTQYNKNHMDLCEGVVSLKTKVTDACSKANLMLSYRLWLDLDGNGTTETYLSSSDNQAWPIETTIVADTLNARIKFPPGVGLPYGKNMIEWIAQDGCGNQTICKYQFIVKDCNPPTAICYNGLSVNIMETGMITLWATDFIQKKFDNCVSESQIKVGIRKKGTGTGFPVFGGSVTFDCDELGQQDVEVWVADAYGNAAFCETYLDVQDPLAVCFKPAPSTVAEISEQVYGEERWSTESKAIVKPAMPNPSNGLSSFEFFLPENGGEVAVSVFDAAGKMLQSSRTAYPQGWHRAELDLKTARSNGVFILKIEFGGQVWSQRLVLIP